MAELSKIKRFLIVDDDRESQTIMKALLGQLKIQDITVVEDAEAALDKLDPKRIEFLIINWDLRGKVSGSVFLQRLKSQAAFRHLPFCVYSQSFDEEDLTLLNEYGIENLFSAPIDREEASKVLKKSIEKESKVDKDSRILRQAAGYLADEDPSEAMFMVKSVLSNKKLKALSLALKAEIHVFNDELEDAEKDLDASLEIDGRNSNAMQTMAKVYSRTNRHREAIQMLRQMIRLSPKNLSHMLSLGAAYIDANKHEKAREKLKQVEKRDPNNPRLKEQLGIIAFKEKNFDLAEEILTNTLNKTELGRTFNNVGIGQVNNGKIKDGIKSYQVALKILGQNRYQHRLIYNKGVAFKKNGDLRKAFELFYESYKMNSRFDKAYSSFIRLVKKMDQEGIPVDTDKVKELKILRKKEVEKMSSE